MNQLINRHWKSRQKHALDDTSFHDSTNDGIHARTVASRGEDSDLHAVRKREQVSMEVEEVKRRVSRVHACCAVDGFI